MQWMMMVLEWWKAYRLETIAAKAKADNYQYDTIRAMVEAQADFMGQWLKGFQVTELPTSSVRRDEDVAEDELNREYEKRNQGQPTIDDELLAQIQRSIHTSSGEEL